MSQNQQQKNRKLTVKTSKKACSIENEKSNVPQQYRRSRNDDGNSGGSEDDEYSDTSSIVSRDSNKKTVKKNMDMEEFDKVEYAKLLAELFPSKYSVNKARTLQSSYKNQNVQSSSSEEEEQEKQYPRRSARLQKQYHQQNNEENQGKQRKQEKQVKQKEKNNEENKNSYEKQEKENVHKIKKQKYNEHEEENLKKIEPTLDKNGNYNIVINLQEPQFDYSSDRYDDDDSEMNDSVFDDESISSDQEESSESDETYRESDDDDDSEGSFRTESSCRDGEYYDNDDDSFEQEEVTTRDFQKNSSSSVLAEKADINFTINGKSILKDNDEKNKVNYKSKNDDKKKKDTRHDEDNKDDLGSDDEATIQTIKQQMQAILELDKNNKIARNTLEQMIEKEERIKRLRKKKTVKQIRSNTRKFGRLLQKKNSANDLKYFKKYLTHEQQTEVLKELSELNKIMLVDKPYRLTLLESKIPQHYKAIALKRIQNLRYMDTCSGEYFKVKNWVDTFMTIPFGVHRTLSITMDVGVEQCHTFMEEAKDILDSAVYGLNDAKMQIMQMVGQWISNPLALGSAIAIKGPPGTGKTTLVKEGISKILGRDFAFIALGGATDSSFLEGHSYTYEGSTWGKIVEILIRCKSMNPVIFFDELDKLSDTPKGEEITGILTHLTDTSQNSQFHDKYFSEIAFDLSKCLFIFSYNDESKVNPILLDRMYRIHTNGYGKKDKTHIAQKYLIPKIQSEVAFKPNQIIIPDETIEYIVEHHTNKEDGVRNLKRCLEIIFTKLNLYRLMKPGSKLFDKDSTSIEVVFPFTVTSNVVDMMIKKAETNTPPMFMYT
jgi:ATP-dependent Lon protease